MNLLENENGYKKKKKNKIIMIIISVFVVLFLIISSVLFFMIMDVQNKMLKVSVDGKLVSMPEGLFQTEDGITYVSIKDYAKIVGYKSYNGDHTSEEQTKCYIQNDYEEASYTLNSNKIYKNLLTATENEYYDLENPVKMINDKLYASIEGIQIGTNTLITYQQSNNQYTVYTLPYLVKYYGAKNKDSALIVENASFVNQKALLQNLMVVVENGKYGVRDLDGKEIVGKKYTNIEYVESSKDFIVTTDEKKMGILSLDGTTKIEPTYDQIKLIDRQNNLYLVENNGKYGVINQNGNTVIFLEYDKIGIDPEYFKSNNIKNQYLLFENCIPVQRDRKWGIFDKTGNLIVPIEYDQLGYIAASSEIKANNDILIIPEYKSIVVKKGEKYGIVSSAGKEYVPCVLDSVYSTIVSGQENYYMTQGEKVINLVSYFEEKILKTEKDNQPSNNNNENTNTEASNTTTNTEVNNNQANTVNNPAVQPNNTVVNQTEVKQPNATNQ